MIAEDSSEIFGIPTAMTINDKEDIMAKPKVIKTLRLDQVDSCIADKKKKQRIRNLRHVCTKILDFCDRQDADDMFFEQIASVDSPVALAIANQAKDAKLSPTKKTKRKRRKIKRAKSLYAPYSDTISPKETVSERKDTISPKDTVSERKQDATKNDVKTSQNTSTLRMTRTARVSISAYKTHKLSSETSSKNLGKAADGDNKNRPPRRRVVKRKCKQKKIAMVDSYKPPGWKVRTRILNYVNTKLTRPLKKPVQN